VLAVKKNELTLCIWKEAARITIKNHKRNLKVIWVNLATGDFLLESPVTGLICVIKIFSCGLRISQIIIKRERENHGHFLVRCIVQLNFIHTSDADR